MQVAAIDFLYEWQSKGGINFSLFKCLLCIKTADLFHLLLLQNNALLGAGLSYKNPSKINVYCGILKTFQLLFSVIS